MNKTITRISLMLMLCLALMSLSACSAATKSTAADGGEAQETTDAAETESSSSDYTSGLHHAEITVKGYGTIYVELNADVAPVSVSNFVSLAQSGFYDGLTFHRIMDGFMIQGGDPTGTGRGGSDNKIIGEFSANGIKNTLSHTRGAISMARSSASYDSASSQFFIVQTTSTYLDGNYACFGYVTEGMDIVDQICKDTKVEDNNGTVLAANQPIIESIVITD